MEDDIYLKCLVSGDRPPSLGKSVWSSPVYPRQQRLVVVRAYMRDFGLTNFGPLGNRLNL